jgi:hypothetical protein
MFATKRKKRKVLDNNGHHGLPRRYLVCLMMKQTGGNVDSVVAGTKKTQPFPSCCVAKRSSDDPLLRVYCTYQTRSIFDTQQRRPFVNTTVSQRYIGQWCVCVDYN